MTLAHKSLSCILRLFLYPESCHTGGDGRTDRTVVTDTTEVCTYLSHDRDVTPRKVHPGHEYS